MQCCVLQTVICVNGACGRVRRDDSHVVCLANHLQFRYSDSNLIAVCDSLILSSTVAAVFGLYRPAVCNCTNPGVVICIIFVSELKENIAGCCC